jgi:hypothetical protein
VEPIDEQVARMEEPRPPDPREDDGRRNLALAGGLGAAVAGGLAWAGLVLYANVELGIAAWGIGILVGATVGLITDERSRGLGMAAAGIAAVGLLLGKLLITVGSTGALAEELFEDGDYLEAVVAWQMYAEEELSPETHAGLETTIAEGDTISDALWEDMTAQAGMRLAGMSEPERRAVAEAEARRIIGDLGVVDAIRVQMSAWDLIWFALALGTAFQMVAGATFRDAEEVAEV